MNEDAAAKPSLVIGSGKERVILVHGWMAGHQLFLPMLDYLDQKKYTYAFMDCRGYGSRQAASKPYNVRTIASDVLAIADGLGWKQFHIVGHSMAGMAAQWLIATAPHRLASVLLLASVPASGASVSRERRQLLLGALNDKAVRAELIDRNTGGQLDRGQLSTLLEVSLSSALPDAMREYLPSWSDDDFSASVNGAQVPVTAVVGELDPGSTCSLMERTVMKWLPSAKLIQLKGVGHYPMFESPAEFVRVLERCLSDAPGTAQLFNPGY